MARLRTEKYGPSSINLAELEAWCSERKQIPENLDQVFVADFSHGINNNKLRFFRLFLTTKRLLLNAPKTKHLTIDATYKLIYQGFPVIQFGTTDREKHFHPFGLAITSNETHEDFRFVFDSLKVVVEKEK